MDMLKKKLGNICFVLFFFTDRKNLLDTKYVFFFVLQCDIHCKRKGLAYFVKKKQMS